MAEDLRIIETASKEEKYKALIPQLTALLDSEPDLIANLSNAAAALKQTFNFFWVGFYLLKENQLVLGPFQGPVACTRIEIGKGVCGKAVEDKKIIVVEDVDKFPDHIACSSESKSEIVVPGFKGENVALVLDIDSNVLSDFNQSDEKYLQEVMKIIEQKL